MSAEWSTEGVLALAPDPASAKAGRGLGSPRMWSNLGRGDGLLWGECRGSGKDPYRTKVDPDEPAFSCSCPSRKSPCKHALGLLLVRAESPGEIAEAPPPAWVVDWKEGRAKRAEARKEKVERGPAPVDEAARAKRQAARDAKVTAGLEDLSLWLSDLVLQGFASLGAKSGSVWDDQARRMIDAQAPGVARRLRQVDGMTLAGDGWQASLLDRLARLHLLAEGYRRREALPPEVAEDVRSAIGFPVDLDAVRAGPGVRDRWQVLGQAFAVEDKVRVRRTWLLGRDSRRPALLLDFAAGAMSLDAGLPTGFVVDAEFAFVPGSVPLRALVKERHTPPESTDLIAGGSTIAAAFSAYGAALAKDPWLELWPIVLDEVVLMERDGIWSVRDAEGSALPLSRRFSMGWPLLALTGGSSFTLCGEFDGATLAALGALVGGGFVPLVTAQMSPLETTSVAPPVSTAILGEATASAIVGVDRRPPPAPPADGPIAAACRGLDGLEPTSRLLAVAAAESLYGRAGRKPALDPGPVPEPGPPEAQPECSPESARRLRRMLGGEHAVVLPEWLELLSASGRRTPHDAIVDLLDLQPSRDLPVGPLIRAIGARGRWLAARNPRWREFAGLDESADPAAIWETGERHERLAALRALREADPARAAGLVATTFASEPADVRRAILDEHEPGLSMADEPFLESCLDDRSKEVRSRAAALLRTLPDSRLCGRMTERAKGILSWKPGLLGLGKGSLIVEPPAACDKAMIRDGISPKLAMRGTLGERGVWLSGIITATPPAAISAMLGRSPAEIVEAMRGHDWREAFFEAWAVSVTDRDAAWAEALLDATVPSWIDADSRPAFATSMCNCLPGDRRSALVARLLRSRGPFLASSHPAAGLIDTLDRPIEPTIAREVLARVRGLLDDEREALAGGIRPKAWPSAGGMYDPKYHDYDTGQMIEGLADGLPLDLADEAAEGFDPGDEPRPLYAASYAQMLDRLTFRRDMHREFAP